MKLLFTASHAWSELTDIEDLETVVAHLMASLVDSGPVLVHAPANRPRLVQVLEASGHFPTVYAEEGGPPCARYDRAFFLSPSPSSPEVQMGMDWMFSSLADTWMVVHVPPGSTKALVQTGSAAEAEGDSCWARPATALDMEMTQVDGL